MTTTDKCNRYRDKLLALRGQLDAQMSQLAEEVEDVFDVADRAEWKTGVAVNIRLATHEATLRKEIDDALERMDANTFAICERCQAVIGVPRLNALPYARYCVRCERQIEQAETAA
jgi:DnaK suppressor protein